MFKTTKRFLAALVVIAAVCVPSVAYARVDLNPGQPPVVTPATVPADQTPSHSVATTATASGTSFHWGDAGIGAAGMLLLLSAGGSAVIISRRQHRRAIAT